MASQSSSTIRKLTINDLPLLYNALNPVASKCFALGLQLGVEEARIRTIVANNRNDCEAQLREIISKRLKQDSPLTWLNIVTALKSPTVDENSLASQIEQKYLLQPVGSQSPVRGPSDRGPYRSRSPVRGPSDRGHYRSQSPVRGPSDRGPYRSQSPVRGPSDRGHYRSQSPVRGPSDRGHYRSQSSVRGPSDRGHYRSQSPVRGPSDREHYRSQSPVRGPSDRGHYRSQSPVRGPSDRGHYRSQSPVRGPSDRGHYRSRSPVRGPSDRGHYRSQSPVRGPSDRGHYRSQSPVRGPSDRGHYRSRSPVRGPSDRGHYRSQSPVRGPSDRGHYRSRSPVRGPSDRGHYRSWSTVRDRGHYHSYSVPCHLPDMSACGTPHTCPSHQMTPWSTPYGYLPHPQEMYQAPHPSVPHPYLIPSHMSAPTRPLQVGTVGGQLESQSHMSHGQPEISHVQLQRSSNIESCSPPAKRPHLQSNSGPPSTESSSVSHSVKSAHHRSPMDTFVHYVKITYKQCEIEKNLNVVKWPPTPSKIFINLACIDWESVVNKEEADEYTRAMVEDGNVDVIMKKKTNIDIDDIVRDLPATVLEKVVLVEGAPGVGKSTFAWEFCRRWERGEIAQQYQLVLLLRLRDERMSRAKSLNDLIYHPSESVCQAVVEELESTLGVNTLIILEGFDELPDPQRRKLSIFLQLILGQLLPFATILVTSRPWATGALLVDIKHRIFKYIEILGFTEENITKYVTSVFTGEGKKTASAIDQTVGDPDEVSAKKNIDDVMAYIGKYPQIKACMYIPLNAAIVVSIYRESMKSKWVLPTTLTELYNSLTQILLLCYLRGHSEYSHQKCVKSFEDLPGEVYNQLLVISKIAYKGICRYGISVQLIFPDIPDDFETLGLMQSVSQLFMDGQKTSHNFLHLTFQEFLAAFLISTMSPAEQLEHFQRHKDGRLRVVLRFLAGLTKLNKVTPDKLKSLLGEPTVEQSDEHQTPYCNPMRPDVCVSSHHTNWLFEAQNSKLLQSLFHNHTASFIFTRGMLPLEYYSVGYCIAHSHSKWSLTFNEDTEEEKLHMLVSGAETGDGDYRVAVKTISTCMTPEKIHIILNGLSPCVDKLHLNIPDNGNSLSLPPLSTLHILELQVDNNKSAFNISCDLSFSSLEALIISSSREDTTLGVKTCKAIGKLLSSTTSLKTFCLSLNIKSRGHVSNKGMEVISKGLSDNIAVPLESLDIDCRCTFTTTATRSLVQFITRSTTLQYLKIHIGTLVDADILARGLSDNVTLPLKSLNIECNCTVTTTATRSLVQFITRSTALQYIRICHVTFSAQGLIELTEAIHHCSRLQKKKLKELTFHVECSEDVVNLKHMFNEYPDMRDVIDWEEAAKISRSHKYATEINASTLCLALECSCLTFLDFSNMSISDTESDNLAEALRHSSTLKGLDLFNSNISDAGAVALAQALHHNSTLEWLNLSGNKAIGEEGTHQLVQALTVNTSITKATPYGGGLRLPRRCEEYATQCTQYNTVKDRMGFF